MIVCDHGELVAKPSGRAAVNGPHAAEGSSFLWGSGRWGQRGEEGGKAERPRGKVTRSFLRFYKNQNLTERELGSH